MCDDFHGTMEWEIFASSMRRVFRIARLSKSKIKTLSFIPSSIWMTATRSPAPVLALYAAPIEQDGFEARWRGVYDDKGRLMVAICHNMDLGDTWQWADDPRYPEKYAALGLRIGVNYVIYAMTH